jgi:hypothetical protein
MEKKQTSALSTMADRYLDRHNHTETAYEHVHHVLTLYDFMVGLALKRAIGQFEIESETGGAIIYQFPSRQAASSARFLDPEWLA